jgi:hypothetical protein
MHLTCASGMMVAMLLKHGEQICGFPAIQAGNAARTVDAWQWCSAGVLARELQVNLQEARALLLALEGGRYLTRHTGRLPDGQDGAWLPEEEDCSEPLLLWHLTSPNGMQLAKAHVGSPMPRPIAEGLLGELLDRVLIVNADPCATHVIQSFVLYGSFYNPDQEEVTDVDLVAFTRRTQRGDSTALGPSDCLPQWPSDEQVCTERAALRTILAAGHDRLDIEVVDERSDNPWPLPLGATWKRVFP